MTTRAGAATVSRPVDATRSRRVGVDDVMMVPSSERTLLITLRARLDPEASTGPVITVRRLDLSSSVASEQVEVSASAEEALGIVRDWLSEFAVAE